MCFYTASHLTMLDWSFFPHRGVFQSEIFARVEHQSPERDSQIKSFWDLLMFLLSLCVRFWPRLPDERQRIISKADLIYVLRRWGHPNDLPRRGHHQSPPTRGHSKHAGEGEPVGRPNNPQACVHMWTSVCMVYRFIIFLNVWVWKCVWFLLLRTNCSALSCVYSHRGFVFRCKCDQKRR